MIPLVSFIITYHNEPEVLLQACLESILALPLGPEEGEIILVDDGSESVPILPQQGVRYVRQEQAGLSVARNTGLSHAQGQYIQFVDADDCIIQSAYMAVLEQMRSEKVDVVLFKMTTTPSTEPIRKVKRKLWNGGKFLQRRNLRAAACAYTFRREILGDLSFYPGLLHEDELFTPQLFLNAKTLVELDVKAYFYRQHEGTITHSKSPEQIRKRLDDIHFIINLLGCLEENFLERRMRQLTVDYLQKTWTLTHSKAELRRRITELRKEELLPLPLRCYSLRYLLVVLIARFF